MSSTQASRTCPAPSTSSIPDEHVTAPAAPIATAQPTRPRGSALARDLQAELAAGRGAAAVERCRAHIAATPDDAEGHRHLAQLLAAAADFPAAHRSARRACELAPDDPRSWSDLGRVYALERQLDEAARCFTEAIQIDPRHADGWHNLGTALK